MSVEEEQTAADSLDMHADGSVLEAVVPSKSSVNFEGMLREWDGTPDEQNATILPFLRQRQLLFLDERLTAYVVLRSPISDLDALRSYASRLEVTLETHAVGTPAAPQVDGQDYQQSPPQQVREKIFSKQVRGVDFSCIVPNIPTVDDEGKAQTQSYIVWSVQLSLGRPKAKLQRLAVFLSASASWRQITQSRNIIDDEYLPSLTPRPHNLLEAFSFEAEDDGVKPYLPANLLSNFTPAIPNAKALLQPLKNSNRRLYRLASALLWRIRFSKIHQPIRERSVIASLDFEVSPYMGCDVTVDEVEISMESGRVVPTESGSDSQCPVTCRPGDQVSLLYSLSLDEETSPGLKEGSASEPVHIKAISHVHYTHDSASELVTEWRTSVDMRSPQQSLYLQSLRNAGANAPAVVTSPHRPLQHIQPLGAAGKATEASRLTISTAGPGEIYAHESFFWTVLVTNHSSTARKLAIMPIPKRRRPRPTGHRVKVSTGSVGQDQEPDRRSIAETLGRDAGQELLVFSPEVHIGPLEPEECRSVELEFYPMQAGFLQLECLRLVDLSSQEATDVRDLPDILVQDSRKDSKEHLREEADDLQ